MMGFNFLEKSIFEYFIKYEVKQKQKKTMKKDILPKYVTKRHVKIISNGKVVFDNDGGRREIPDSIQYAIKRYGYPPSIKSSNKTPLIYNIQSETSMPLRTSDICELPVSFAPKNDLN